MAKPNSSEIVDDAAEAKRRFENVCKFVEEQQKKKKPVEEDEEEEEEEEEEEPIKKKIKKAAKKGAEDGVTSFLREIGILSKE